MIFISHRMSRRVRETSEYKKGTHLSEKTQDTIAEKLVRCGVSQIPAENFAAALDLDELNNGNLGLISNKEKELRRKQYVNLKNCLERILETDPVAINRLEIVLSNRMWNQLAADPRIPDLPTIPVEPEFLCGTLMETVDRAIKETTRKQGLKKIPTSPEDFRRLWVIHHIEEAWLFYIPLKPRTTHPKSKATRNGKGKETTGIYQEIIGVIISELDEVFPLEDYKKSILQARSIDWNDNISTSFFLGNKPIESDGI